MPKTISSFESFDETSPLSHHHNGDETLSDTMNTTTTNNTSLSSTACLRIAEMKSIQPYSTKDEYIYAMKEDLAEWFNSMRCGKGQLHIESKLFFNLLERHTIEKETLVWTDRDQRTETEEILLGKDKM